MKCLKFLPSMVMVFAVYFCFGLPFIYAYTGCFDPALDTEARECIALEGFGGVLNEPLMLGERNQADKYFLLLEDVSCAGTCFKFPMGSSNIVLDLNGHTLSYATATSGHGIEATWLIGGSQIKNGSLNGADRPASHAIVATAGVSGLEVYDLDIIARGQETSAVRMGIENSVRDIILRDMDIVVHTYKDDPCSHYGGFSAVSINRPEGKIEIYNLNITGEGQTGIELGYEGAPFSEPARIHGNYIRMYSEVRGAHAISVGSNWGGWDDDPILIYDNTIDQISARGIMVGGANVTSDRGPGPVKIYNNIVKVREGQGCEYEGADGNALGIRMRFGAHDVEVYNNQVYAYAGTNIVPGRGPGHAQGLQLGSPEPWGLNNCAHDNYIEAITNDPAYTAVGLYSKGAGNNPPFDTHYNNTIATNNMAITAGFSDGGDKNTLLARNIIRKTGTDLGVFAPVTVGREQTGGVNISFVDSIGEAGVDVHNISFSGVCNGSGVCPYYTDVNIAWTLKLNVKDASNNPVSGASVTATNIRGEVLEAITDAQGQAELVLKEKSYEGYTDPAATLHNPYSILVSKNGFSIYENENLTMDQPKTILISLAPAGTNQPPVLFPIGNKTAFPNNLLSFQVNAQDPDLDPLSFTVSPLPSGASFNLLNTTFNWTPQVSQLGAHSLTFRVSDSQGASDSETVVITVRDMICGDVNGNGRIALADLIYLIGFLFRGGAAPIPFEAGDMNNDGQIQVSDITYLISYLFRGGPAPICDGTKSAPPPTQEEIKETIDYIKSVCPDCDLSKIEAGTLTVEEPIKEAESVLILEKEPLLIK